MQLQLISLTIIDVPQNGLDGGKLLETHQQALNLTLVQ